MNIYATPFRPTQLLAQERPTGLRFQGAPTKPVQVAMGKAEAKGLASFFIKLENFKKKSGDEMVNVFVTAFGTGIVAPLVIALNKLNDEDTHTKIYSAMRQPISAVLALITQAGINMPVPRTIDRLARRGVLGDKYLGPARNIHDSAPTEEIAERQRKNKYFDSQYENALKKPGFREDVAKMMNKLAKKEHLQQVEMAKKGRSSYPPELKPMLAAEVTLKDAQKYTARNLKQFKYLAMFGISVLTLYPTCVVLNWIYPRFMDLFFPSLTKDEKHDPSQDTTEAKSK